MRRTLRLAVAALGCAIAVGLVGCVVRPPVPEVDLRQDLPAVAAQYRTQVFHDRRVISSSEWRLWREPHRVVRENLVEQTGELWQRDGRTIFLKKLFHEDRRGIEFQMEDLDMLGALPAWTQTSLLIDAELLPALKVTKTGWRAGYPYRSYSGSIRDVRWDITLRVDLMLPVSVERRQGHRIERVALLQAYPLNQAPWQPTPDDLYAFIDFADLGDHETDPFILRVQNQIDVGHAH